MKRFNQQTAKCEIFMYGWKRFLKYRIFDIFSVRSISTNENTCAILVFLSEIKDGLALKKVKFSVSFMLKNGNYVVYTNASAIRTETQHFPSRFASNLMLLAFLSGLILFA